MLSEPTYIHTKWDIVSTGYYLQRGGREKRIRERLRIILNERGREGRGKKLRREGEGRKESI